MSLAPFKPCYILQDELNAFGIPGANEQADVMNLVQFASSIIDIECGRIDGDGNGSLVYTTYTQRVLLQSRSRNLVTVAQKPIVGLSQATLDELALAASGSVGGNFYHTGALANALQGPNAQLSGILGASGRYSYSRQDMNIAYPDLSTIINPMNLVTLFGGPAPWVPIDVTQIDYDKQTGELWIPAGLQLSRYTEVLLQYNSGYDPRNMPIAIKFVAAAIVKNAMAKGDGTTALLQMSLGKSGANFSYYNDILDPRLSLMLQPFRTVRAY